MLCDYEMDLDFGLRVASMVMLGIFFVYTLRLSRKAKAEGIGAKKNYFLSFSFFFLMFLLNYIQTELNLAEIFNYPDLIPSGFGVDLGIVMIQPIDSDIFLFLFFFLGAIPLAFAIEKFLLMHDKIILTPLCLAAVILNVLLFFIPLNELLATIVILVDYLAMIITVLTVLIIYLRTAIIGGGKMRSVGLLMFFGLILQIGALFLSSMSLGDFPLSGAEISHIVGLTGFILIFLGIIQMQ